MQLALSIRYGGQFVDAGECDYNSFRDLGLLCPICRKTVYLVAATRRESHYRQGKDNKVSVVKEASVPAHFCHHPDTNKESVEACENRASKITVTQRLAAESKARGQRQRAFMAHFWKIIQSSARIIDFEDCCEAVKSCYIQGYTGLGRSERDAEYFFQAMIDACLADARDCLSKYHLEDIIESIGIWVQMGGKTSVSRANTLGSVISDSIQEWRSSVLDTRMQSRITHEAIQFLCQKKQSNMLRELVIYAIYYTTTKRAVQIAGLMGSNIGESFESSLVTEEQLQNRQKCLIAAASETLLYKQGQWEKFAHHIVSDIVVMIGLVRWADKFEELERIPALPGVK
jgi:hypothetical protein